MDKYIEKFLFRATLCLMSFLIGVQRLMCNDFFVMGLSIVDKCEEIKIKL